MIHDVFGRLKLKYLAFRFFFVYLLLLLEDKVWAPPRWIYGVYVPLQMIWAHNSQPPSELADCYLYGWTDLWAFVFRKHINTLFLIESDAILFLIYFAINCRSESDVFLFFNMRFRNAESLFDKNNRSLFFFVIAPPL